MNASSATGDAPLAWVVVGAGSAGCVVARRLVDAGHRVTLVEAGPALEPGRVPIGIDADNSFAALLDGRVHTDLLARRTSGTVPRTYLRGRGVGGSSAVNAMVGLTGDIDQYGSWGWTDAEHWSRSHLIPLTKADDDELGRVDQALLAASPHAVRAPLTRRGRRRVTSAEAYLWPVLDHDLLTVRSDASVDRVLVDGSRAIGVRLVDGEVVAADRVVICAGAIHTPAILLRSDLDVAGVGDGLQDHPAASLLLELRDSGGEYGGGGEVDVERDRRASATGLSTSTIIDADPIQILAMNHIGVHPGPGMLLVANMRPVSASGTVRIASTDPTVEPVVEFDLLSDPADVATLRSGVRLALDLLAQPAFEAIVERVVIDDRGTTVEALDSDAAIERWLLAHSADYVHASGTCAIGRVTERDGSVRGHHDLFVCDASLFPTIPNVNTHLPTTMLAEHLVAGWIGEA